MRLDGNGTAVTPPRRIADRLLDTQYSAAPFTLAGDTLAWQAGPRVAGVAQVRSAPLP
jgi:hypothetical protein